MCLLQRIFLRWGRLKNRNERNTRRMPSMMLWLGSSEHLPHHLSHLLLAGRGLASWRMMTTRDIHAPKQTTLPSCVNSLSWVKERQKVVEMEIAQVGKRRMMVTFGLREDAHYHFGRAKGLDR